MVEQRLEAVAGETVQRRLGVGGVGAGEQGGDDVEQQRAHVLERALGLARHLLHQRLEGRGGHPGGLGALRHDRNLRGDEVALGRRHEQPADQVQIEGAGDRFGEQQHGGRRFGAGPAVAAPPGAASCRFARWCQATCATTSPGMWSSHRMSPASGPPQ